jgi:hypothetical protein
MHRQCVVGVDVIRHDFLRRIKFAGCVGRTDSGQVANKLIEIVTVIRKFRKCDPALVVYKLF